MIQVKFTPRITLGGHRWDMRDTTAEFAIVRPFGGASLIYADPPWQHEDWSQRGNKIKTPGHQYACQPLSWIEQLPVEVLASHDCLLWLWATNPMLPQALGTVEAWGFTFKSAGTWVKRSVRGKIAVGPGRRMQSSNEPFIIATRGHPRVSSLIKSALATGADDADPFASMGLTVEALRREHSRKPDEAIQMARMMVDGPAVELFGRQRRDGWSAWGNQLDQFKEAAE